MTHNKTQDKGVERHSHHWNFVRTFIASGKPKLKQQIEVPIVGSSEKPKVKMWLDERQEYALYHCVCGKRKEVSL